MYGLAAPLAKPAPEAGAYPQIHKMVVIIYNLSHGSGLKMIGLQSGCELTDCLTQQPASLL